MTEIYTDGSIHPNPGGFGGWAFVVYEDGAETFFRAGGARSSTNNRMELKAVWRALEWLGPRAAVIHSDSQYVVNCMVRWRRQWAANSWSRKAKSGGGWEPVSNSDMLVRMDALVRPCHDIRWTRGHCGTRGNERADGLAGQARLGMKAAARALAAMTGKATA